MRKREPALEALLEQVESVFPPSHPLKLRASADAFAPHAERFPGGYVARWFAAFDGQVGDEPFADAHVLCSLEEGEQALQIADRLRAQPEGYWVEPHWFPISSDGAGQHHMIDDRDGRVLAVAHDDDAIGVVASSPEAWLQQLVDGHAKGTVVWDPKFGLIDAEQLDGIRARTRAAEAARAAQPKPLDPRLGLGFAVVCVVATLVLVRCEEHRKATPAGGAQPSTGAR